MNITVLFIYYRDQILDDPQEYITLATLNINLTNTQCLKLITGIIHFFFLGNQIVLTRDYPH